MTKFCTACGAILPDDARFCGTCGAAIAVTSAVPIAPPPPPTVPVAEVPDVSPVLPQEPVYAPPPPPAYTPPPEPPEQVFARPVPVFEEPEQPVASTLKLWIGGGLGLLAILGLIYYFAFRYHSGASEGGTPTAQVTPKPVEAPKAMYTVTQANIRDKATATGSNIIGKLPRGTAVSGTLALGEDGVSDWLTLAGGKGFVGAINLSETQPPVLSKVIADKTWTADKAIDIWSAPDNTSSLLDRAAAGTPLTLAGLTANDFIEIKLRKGGVGYIADGARILSLSDAKPIAFSFNPNSCNFGGEIEALFDQMRKKRQGAVDAIDRREFPNDQARDTAMARLENSSDFMKLQRGFNGLTITGIAQHYESQSVYFADPPAKVIEVFRGLGLKMGKKGSFVTQDLYAGIAATDRTGAAYGKSDLSCGV
jgi:zinc-ribbon domain